MPSASEAQEMTELNRLAITFPQMLKVGELQAFIDDTYTPLNHIFTQTFERYAQKKKEQREAKIADILKNLHEQKETEWKKLKASLVKRWRWKEETFFMGCKDKGFFMAYPTKQTYWEYTKDTTPCYTIESTLVKFEALIKENHETTPEATLAAASEWGKAHPLRF